MPLTFSVPNSAVCGRQSEAVRQAKHDPVGAGAEVEGAGTQRSTSTPFYLTTFINWAVPCLASHGMQDCRTRHLHSPGQQPFNLVAHEFAVTIHPVSAQDAEAYAGVHCLNARQRPDFVGDEVR